MLKKNPIKKKTLITMLVLGILLLLCSYLIHLYNVHSNEKFRKEVFKIQDKNVYNKDRIKITDILFRNKETYLRLENIASILNSNYTKDHNKCFLTSDNTKLELKIDSKKAKLNGKDYLLKRKIISSHNVNFISKEDIENIYNVVYDENSKAIISKYASKILIIKTDNKDIVKKTQPINLVNKNDIYIAKYKTINDIQKAYKKLIKIKNTIVDIESVIKVSDEENVREITEVDEDTKLSKYIKSHKSNEKIKVAVIDSGINYDLGHFSGRLLSTNINYSSSGKDAKDDFGHGTAVTSIITNVTHNNVKILPIKIINNEGESSILSLYLAISKAIDEDVDIINISLNARYSYEANIIEEIINKANKKNIKVVVSAGNNSSNVKYYTPSNIKSAIVVASSNDGKEPTSYSNKGKTVDYSTYGNFYNVIDIAGNTVDKTGTSYSAAMISGLMASLLTTPKNLDDFIVNESKDLGKFVTYKKYIDNCTDKNEKTYTLLDYIDDWKNISNNKLNDAFNDTSLDGQACFYQLLSKKDKKIFRKKCSNINEPYEFYTYKTNKNGYSIEQTKINEYGDYMDLYKLNKITGDKLYKFLENYDYDKKVTTSEYTVIWENNDPWFGIYMKNCWYKAVDTDGDYIEDSYKASSTDIRYQTILSSTDFETYKDKTQVIKISVLPGYGFINANNFKMSSIGNSRLGKPEEDADKGMFDVIETTYSYSKQKHVTCIGADVDKRCPKCRACLRPYAQDYGKFPGNQPKFDYDYCDDLGHVGGNDFNDKTEHKNLKENGYISINFANTGNKKRNKPGHQDTGDMHTTFRIYFKLGLSSLTIELNQPSSIPVTWNHKTNIVNRCNFETSLLQYSPSCVGYNFKGWKTTNYPNSNRLFLTYELGCLKSHYAIAQWSSAPFTVTYDFNGATKDGSPKKNTVYYEQKMPDVDYIPEKVANITLDYNGSGQTDDYIYYKYKFITYTYTNKDTGKTVNCYDNQGKNGVPWRILHDDTVIAKWDGEVILPDAERTGYNFKGWDTDPNVAKGKYSAGSQQIAGDITLYAIWEPITYTVNLYPDTPSRANNGHYDGYKYYRDFDHESEPIYSGQSGWNYEGDHWTKEFVFDRTRLTELPSEMFCLQGWDVNNPTWYARDSQTINEIGLSINASYYAINLTSTEHAVINLKPSYREHEYTIKFIRTEDPDLLNIISGEIPDMHLLYEDIRKVPEGSELYTVDKKSDQVFRFFICKENGVRYYQNESTICQLTDKDKDVLHFVAQWLPFRIKVDYFSITDRERGKDIIFSEGVFGQLEIQVEEEVEKIKVQFPQADEDYTLSNYMEYVTKYDDRNLDYALDPDLNFEKTYEYNPIGMTDTTPSYPLYPKKSETKQKFFVKYSNKPLVTKKIWIHSYRDRRWINSTATYINFENRDRVPMSGKIRTRIRYDSWLED